MRKINFNRLLAGTMLAAVVAAPALAAPDRVEQVRPLPPPLNDQMPRQHEAAPVPPPAAQPMQQPEYVAPFEPRDNDRAGNSNAGSALDKSAIDVQIGDKLREIITGKQFERRVPGAAERKAIETDYASRSYAPLWISDGRLTSNAKSVIARLKNAEADGLDVADYPVPDFASVSSAVALADGDIRLTNSMMVYARHLAAGRIAPGRVLAEVDYGNHMPEPADIIKKIADARDADAALESFNPPHDGFRALKDKLAELRRNAVQTDSGIPAGAAIHPGDKDARVPALRERLGLTGRPGDLIYDKALFNAIKNVQARADLKPTGVIDGKTLAVINGPRPSQQIERIAANMERWRWLPRDLGRTYVMVNIPDYTLKVVRDRGVVWRTKIVAGKPQTPTPLLSAAMDNVLVNPSWYVPQSIIQNELLPHYASDPHIFDRMGLEVKRGPDGNINVVQPPGAGNALGRIKFNFPNKFQVYLHDTPEKRLFAADKRAFSHGCMRVENPTKFGEVVLAMAMPGQTPSAHQLDGMVGRVEKTFKLANQPMVHLTYQTVFVDDGGRLVLRDDIYGFDARIRAILRSDERRIADVAPPQDPKRDLATARANQEILRRVERREANNPMAFFERLFR